MTQQLAAMFVRECRSCGCTDDDCRMCIQLTGGPCHWVEADLCSACSNAVRNMDAALDDGFLAVDFALFGLSHLPFGIAGRQPVDAPLFPGAWRRAAKPKPRAEKPKPRAAQRKARKIMRKHR